MKLSTIFSITSQRMDEIKSQRFALLVLAAAMMCAAALFFRYAGCSLNYNESHNLMYAASRTPLQLLKIDDMHPPGFYFLMHFWQRVAGGSEMLLRLPSLICCLLSIPLVYRIGKRILDRRTALLATLLFAVSPLTVDAAATLRPYALMTLLFLVSLNAFLNILEQNKLVHHLINSAAILAALFLHYYSILFPIYQLIFLLLEIRRRRDLAVRWTIFQSAAALSYLPIAYVAATHQLRMVNPSGGAGFLTFANFIRLLYVMSPLSQKYIFNISAPVVALAIVFAVLLVYGMRPLKKTQLLVLIVASPIALVALVSNAAHLKFYQAYHFTYLLPVFALLASNGLLKIGRIGSVGGAALLIAAFLLPMRDPNPDWRGCGEYLRRNALYGDKVIVLPDLNDALAYYWPGAQFISVDSVTRVNEEPRRIWLVFVYENIYFNPEAKYHLLAYFRSLGFSDSPMDAGAKDAEIILLSRQPSVHL